MSKDVWVEVHIPSGLIIRIFKSKQIAYTSETHIIITHRPIAVAEIRHQLFRRSCGQCELCQSNIIEKTSHMHEVKHRGQGGEISLVNSVCICADCHRYAHRDRNPRWTKKSVDIGREIL